MRPIDKAIIRAATLCLTFLLAGCATEEHPVTQQTAKAEATLALNVPEEGFEAPATKALTDSEEAAVQVVDVLVFKKADTSVADEDATFLYRAETTTATDGKSFRMAIRADDEYLQQYVVIANARSTINNIEGSLTTSLTKADAMALVVMEKTGAWISTGSYDPLPMWGETKFRRVTDAASASTTVSLLRSVARVNVEVATGAQTDFALTGVWLYKPSTKGLLAPVPANWVEAASAVSTESLPSGGRAAGTEQGWTSLTEAGIALKNSIYTFEAPASTANTDEDAVCLIVGGQWKGETETGYYRIDFYGGEAGQENFLPLLRNHRYDVQITEVKGRGYPTRAEALKAGFTELQAITHTWDEGATGNVVWDGLNYLSVSQTSFEFDPESRTFNLVVGSNYSEGGWKATLEGGIGWLTLDGGSADSGAGDGNKHTLTYRLEANNDAERTTTITVTAGRLKQVITVRQLLTKQLALELGDVEIIFKATDPEEKTLRIEWLPAGTPVGITTTGVSGYGGLSFTGLNALSSNAADDDGNVDNGGGVNFTFKPDAAALETFAERRSTLVVTATNGVQDSVQTVLLRQFDYALTVSGTTAGDLYQQLTTYNLTIKSNGQWEVEVSDTEGALNSHTNPANIIGDPNYTTGEAFSFTTADESKVGKSATLTFRSREGLFDPVVVTVTIWKNEPNSYMVLPGGQVQIPVRKVYDLWETDYDLNDGSRGGDPNAMKTGSFTAELLWQDEPGLIPVQPSLSGSGRDALITVRTEAGKTGNAVVVMKENGEIRWSWHIWVVDYEPDNGGQTYTNPNNGLIIMDRYLGATSNQPPADDSDVSSLGLLYQWGRKDPFPNRSAMNLAFNNSKAIYLFGSTTPLTEGDKLNPAAGTGVKREPTTVNYNLANAIKHPLTYYWGKYDPDYPNDVRIHWYSDTHPNKGIVYRDGFWGPEYKSSYDPCPEGWRVASGLNNDYPGYFIQPGSWVLYRGVTLSIGFFPAAGFRIYDDGIFGAGELYDSNASDSWLGWMMRYNNISSTNNVRLNTTGISTMALPIRCVRTTK